MKNECSIVRDLLPLYTEGMLSEESRAFVEEHLKRCQNCFAEFESLNTPQKLEAAEIKEKMDEAKGLISVKKKVKRSIITAVSVCLAIVFIIYTACTGYAIYLKTENSFGLYSIGEAALRYLPGDIIGRIQTRGIMELAHTAFADSNHSEAEAEELYGKLAQYANSYNASRIEYSLDLLSAHIIGSKGYMWVEYTKVVYSGETIRHGSWSIECLWIIEKDTDGEWIVVQIKERP